ncbi:helix-turn-helix domain-containing protein [Ursidibacter sp. B-7004-1]
MKINDKIRLLRESREWSQEDMATKLNMSTKGYAKIERGETRSNLIRLEQISEVLGMDFLDLLAFGEDRNIYINTTDVKTNIKHSNISLFNGNSEIDRLNTLLSHKEETILYQNKILAQKDEIIEMQKRELTLLRKMLDQETI